MKIEELNLSKLNNIDYMFYNCTTLKYLNLTNFYSNITSSKEMLINCNSDLIYCIDDTKEYQFLSQLINYRKNCSDMCIKYYSKKYVKESNSCIDSCSTEIIYKYDYNNICLEKCPNNTILSNDNIKCNSIKTEDNENKDNENNNKITVFIIAIVVCVLIFILIIIFIVKICRRRKIKNNDNETLLEQTNIKNEEAKNAHIEREMQNITRENEKIKIIFNFNQERTEILKPRRTSFKDLIIYYLKKKHFKNNEMIIFIFDGQKISYEEAINDDKKLSEFIPSDINEKEILVYDWTSLASQSSQN